MTTSTVLAVDHDAAHLQSLCELLCAQGHQVHGFSTMASALAHLRDTDADVLLLNTATPDAGVPTALRRVHEINPDVMTIVLAEHDAAEAAMHALQDGADDYLPKPITPVALSKVIQRALQPRRLRQENAALRQQVEQHRAALQVADQELQSFVYAVAHDLRAPLRAIRGFCGIYLEDYGSQTPPAGRELLDKAVDGAVRMNRLIEALLHFSRCSRQPLACTEVAMDELARSVFGRLAAEHPDRRLQLRLDSLPSCPGDRALLEQVLVHLLANAIKFTRERDPALIEVSAQRGAQELIYAVRDNGVGFDMQYADKLFGVFQRLHPPSQFEGDGMGLALVQRIIQRHGGRVWADSQPGQGACFHFALPISAAVDGALDAAGPAD